MPCPQAGGRARCRGQDRGGTAHQCGPVLRHRTIREVVTLNLFLALQDSIGIATHWLADAGWDVPQSYGEVFTVLGKREVIDRELALRLRAAAGLRNLIAHQYGTLDFDRIFAIAASQRGDLLAFCEQLARSAESESRR